MSRKPSVASRILKALQVAHPEGIGSTQLIRDFGPAAKTRVNDLSKQGWDIATDEGDAESRYRLRCLEKGEPEIVGAGVVLKYDSLQGWTARTHEEARVTGQVPESTLEKAQRAALDAYRAVIDPYLLSRPPCPVVQVEELELDDLGPAQELADVNADDDSDCWIEELFAIAHGTQPVAIHPVEAVPQSAEIDIEALLDLFA